VKKGDHFAAFEQPALFTQELRECFRSAVIRGSVFYSAITATPVGLPPHVAISDLT
jgi:hypothetical protein